MIAEPLDTSLIIDKNQPCLWLAKTPLTMLVMSVMLVMTIISQLPGQISSV